jgi:amino acid adenylation domain-containing protein
LWFLQQLDPESIAYNTTNLLQFTGGVDHRVMEQAINEVIRRHEPLRTVFPNISGQPVQVIHPFTPISLPLIELSDCPPDEHSHAILKYSREIADKPYHLQDEFPFRYALLNFGPEKDILLLCTHHIASDAWSREVLVNDLLNYYGSLLEEGTVPYPELSCSYSDYALWQREWLSEETLATFINHWKQILPGELPVLTLPTDQGRAMMQTFKGKRHIFNFTTALNTQLKKICRDEQITLFQIHVTAFAILLMKYSGQEDIIIGCPFANRPIPELDPLFGLFVNTLPIRLDLSGNPQLRDFITQVRRVMFDAFTWQAAPFEAVVSAIAPERDLSRTPIFQVAINMKNIPKRNLTNKSSTIEVSSVIREDIPAPFDLSLEFMETEGSFQPIFHYNADLFQTDTIQRLAAHYQNILTCIVYNLDQQLSSMEMITPFERRKVLYDWNETRMDFPSVCVPDLVTDQVNKTPDSIAVVCNDTSLTYRELEEQANQLAHYLQQRGVNRKSRVGIFLKRSENSIIALLAILKAGAAYVAIDLAYPSERIAYVLAEVKPSVVVTQKSLLHLLPENNACLCLDTEKSSIESCSRISPKTNGSSYDPMYIIYTSGSTGRPKGSINVHRGVVNYLTYAKKQFEFTTEDSIIQLTSLSFDASIYEIFMPLTCGATVYMMDDAQMRDPDYIQQAILDHQVSYISCVPTMFRGLCESALKTTFRQHNLRLALIAGEALLKSDIDLARKAYGEYMRIINLYGPSECSIIHTCYEVPSPPKTDQPIMPIGKPIGNARAYVLDKTMRPVPPGITGELCVGGTGVGLGYLAQPDLTAEYFLEDPFYPGERMYRTGDLVRQLPDGCLTFVGRRDNQIKIRGYRVELGEIETIIRAYPGIRDAAVLYRKENSQDILSAFFTLYQDQTDEIIDGLKRYLKERLPFYMIPNVFLVIPEMPLTSTGKIDRIALDSRTTDLQINRRIAPRTEKEKTLVNLWEQVLDIEQVGVTDNFFELGGHSLLGVRLLSLIQDQFGVSIPLLLLFKEGTVEALATYLDSQNNQPHSQGIIALKVNPEVSRVYILSPAIYMDPLIHYLGMNYSVFGLFPYLDGKENYTGSVQTVAQIYYQCLTHFDPDGPYHLIGHSANGSFALELSRLLRRNGKQVAFLCMLDAYPPKARHPISQFERYKYHLSRFGKQNLQGKIQYINAAIRQIVNRWRLSAEEHAASMAHQIVGKELEGVRILFKNYHADPYDGPVTLFRAKDIPEIVTWDPLDKWQSILTGALEIVPINGDHITILAEPNVKQLAREIHARITNPPKIAS